MKKDSSTNDEQMTPEDVVRALETRLLQVDSARAKGLEQLGRLRAAKARSLARRCRRCWRSRTGPRASPPSSAAAAEYTLKEYLRRESRRGPRDCRDARARHSSPAPSSFHGFGRNGGSIRTGIRGPPWRSATPRVGSRRDGAWLRWFERTRHPGISETQRAAGGWGGR
jgi:hypothetical protein